MIQDAVDAASPHDTVYVGAGDYYERVTTSDTLALIGMGIDSTRVWWDGYHEYVVGIEKEGYLSDMFIEHSESYVNVVWGGYNGRYTVERCHLEGGGAFVSNTGGYIKNCIFNGPYSSVGTALSPVEYLEVSNCYFYTTDATPINSEADTNVIVNNIIKAHTWLAWGIHLQNGQIYNYLANNLIEVWGPSTGIGMYSIESEEPWFVNNTIDSLYRWQDEMLFGVGLSRGNVSTVITNNSITGGEIAGVVVADNTILNANYNNIWGTEEWFDIGHNTIIDTSESILHEYPMFNVDNNYQLQAYSPLIDAGDPDILDVDGTRSDIGCYGGPGGTSYEYLDLAPLIPCDLSADVDYDNSIIHLNWHYNEEADFNRYLIYRDTISGFEPSIFNQIAEPDTSYYADIDWTTDHNYYYRIAAIDNQDNISDYSDELAVILVSIWDHPGVETPEFTAITNSYPNPFNSSTTIVYHVANIGPTPAEIKIEIYDILGRQVRTLLDERKEVGEHKITWDGMDDSGSDLPSGVYFARIVQWGQKQLSSKRKLVLLR